MSQLMLGIIAGGLFLIGLGALFILNPNLIPDIDGLASIVSPESGEIPPETNPWIEVLSPEVSVETPDTATKELLRSGDEIRSGNVIITDKNGRAIIHFPDSSILRVEKNTSITILAAEYNRQSKNLVSRVFLGTGRVWSKIISLLGPESIWEVRTSNTVATVRGTAFGVESTNGISRVIGSEDMVLVQPIDPGTGEIIEAAKTIVASSTFTEIKNEEIAEIVKNPALFQAKPITEKIREDPWVKTNTEEDQEIEELRRSGIRRQDVKIESGKVRVEVEIKPEIKISPEKRVILPDEPKTVIENKIEITPEQKKIIIEKEILIPSDSPNNNLLDESLIRDAIEDAIKAGEDELENKLNDDLKIEQSSPVLPLLQNTPLVEPNTNTSLPKSKVNDTTKIQEDSEDASRLILPPSTNVIRNLQTR